VQHGGFSGRYVSIGGAGRLIYIHQNTLFAVGFDPARLAVTGTPVPVLEGVSSSSTGGGNFALALDGTFVYLPGTAQGSYSIAWLDPTGKTQPLHAASGNYFTPRFSPDGKRLAFTMSGGKGFDLWVQD